MDTVNQALDQLDQFAANYKAPKSNKRQTWKESLMFDYWMRGAPVPGYPLIYGLRNQLGPSWLHTYKPGTR
jgi:hypothetical protein